MPNALSLLLLRKAFRQRAFALLSALFLASAFHSAKGFSLILLPFGVSPLFQFIFSLVIYLFPLADIFTYLPFN